MQAFEITNSVAKIIDALRRGDLVALCDGEEKLVFSAIESSVMLAKHRILAIALTEKRLQYLLSSQNIFGAQKIDWSFVKDFERAKKLAAEQFFAEEKIIHHDCDDKKIDLALKLLERAELLPAAFIFEDSSDLEAECSVDYVQKFLQEESILLEKIVEAPLTLRGEIKAKLVAFRVSGSDESHYALCVEGKKARVSAPLVRVHSSCFTGDLLDSLACDCHDQLHQAILAMAEGEGGILLYLLQDGRGIGLINKLRAYVLKERGLDTVDANNALGFSDDGRGFAVAGYMLKLLGVTKLRLLTNNPRKAESLVCSGLVVEECVPLEIKTNAHNHAYMKTKAERLGHLFVQNGDDF